MLVLLQNGGPLMWPLLGCSVVAAAIVIDRAVFWARFKFAPSSDMLDIVLRCVKIGEVDKAREMAQSQPGLLFRVISTVLNYPANQIADAADLALSKELPRLNRYQNVLATLTTIAPLLGILGTVMGIIVSFELLGQGGIQDPKAVTAGISQALLTTAAGLGIAIVTSLAHHLIQSRVQTITQSLEAVLSQLSLSYSGDRDAD